MKKLQHILALTVILFAANGFAQTYGSEPSLSVPFGKSCKKITSSTWGYSEVTTVPEPFMTISSNVPSVGSDFILNIDGANTILPNATITVLISYYSENATNSNQPGDCNNRLVGDDALEYTFPASGLAGSGGNYSINFGPIGSSLSGYKFIVQANVFAYSTIYTGFKRRNALLLTVG